MKTNIVSDAELKEIMRETLQFLSDSLSKTLGPYGSTTIIQDRLFQHTITKDGYTILNKIYIDEEEPRTILELVKKISRNLVRKVGDGSTSAIVIANSLYNSITSIMETYNISAKDLLTLLDSISYELIEEIKAISIPVSDDMEELEKIATVSTNNDKVYGKLIADIFKEVGPYGLISVEKSKTERTYFDMTRGFEIGRGYINTLMANQPDQKTCEFLQPFVLMVDAFVDETDIPALAELAGKITGNIGQPFVIVAKGYDNAANVFFHANLMRNKTPLLAIEMAMENKTAKDRFSDLALNLGCEYLRKSELESLADFSPERLGRCTRVVSTETYTRFFEGQGDKTAIEGRIKVLQDSISEKMRQESYIDLESEIFTLKKRIALLGNSMAILYVGGPTEDAKETEQYLLEDAVFACKSALTYGYILGGNLIIPFLLNRTKVLKKLLRLHEDNELILTTLQVISEAFIESFKCVIRNYNSDEDFINDTVTYCIDNNVIFNLKTLNYESIEDKNIINSAETDIEIMKSAMSIIGLLATSNQFVKMNTR